jgi:molybdopterin-guanine dinucleotide biosynthesis protein A
MKMRGFVQAGGGSTRFGADKALAVIAGKTMLERTADLLSTVCGAGNVKIVASAERYPEVSVPVIEDRWPGEGPLGGILTALLELSEKDAENGWSLIVSCDMPFLTKEFLEFLADRARQSKAQVVVPASADGLEPLCACWNSAAAEDLRRIFDSGVRRVSQAMKQLPMEVLDEPQWKRFDNVQRLFWNMNTPADFAEARRILESSER